MKEANSIEQRLEALEATVAALQKRLNPQRRIVGRTIRRNSPRRIGPYKFLFSRRLLRRVLLSSQKLDRHLAQPILLNLAGYRHWKRLDGAPVPRHLERSQSGLA